MAIVIDEHQIVHRAYEPSGLFNDGTSVAIESVSVQPGEHLFA